MRSCFDLGNDKAPARVAAACFVSVRHRTYVPGVLELLYVLKVFLLAPALLLQQRTARALGDAENRGPHILERPDDVRLYRRGAR